ncbi:MAG: flagellar basal body rod protein FlgC [Planctomycetes bacterium]|nr:flagellar basal body rod protein FlgC [Planctomycetota bacterium]
MVGGVFTMMDISASALRAERARMNVHANNLANVNTTRDADGNLNPYRRKRIYFKAGAPELTGSSQLGVEVDKIDDDMTTDFLKKYQPGHPDADENGYVSYPNVSVPMEMVDMMMASRAYEANLTAMDTGKQILRGALQIIA